jgi:O-antigen/teichoic acid export membrane protein
MKRDSGLMQTVLLTGGNLIAVSMSAVALIIISRILGPAQFGVFGVGFSLSQILTAASTLGLSMVQMKYVPKALDHHQVNRIFSYAVRLRLWAYGVIVVIGLVGGGWLAQVLNFSQPTVIYAAFLSVIATLVFEQIVVMLQSLQLAARSAWVSILQGLVKMLLALSMLLTHISNTLVVFSLFVFAPLVTLLPGARWFPEWVRLSLHGNFSREKQLISSMAVHGFVYYLTMSMIDNLDVLMIQGQLNEYQTGLYSGVSRIALLFTTVAYSLSAVLNPRVARYTAQADLKAYAKKTVGFCVIMLLGLLALLPLVPYLIFLTVGQAYLPAETTLRLLTVAGVLTVVSVPLIAVFYSFKSMEWYFSVAGLIQLVVMVAGNLILIPLYGIEGAAMTRIAVKAALILLTLTLGAVAYHRAYHTKQQ